MVSQNEITLSAQGRVFKVSTVGSQGQKRGGGKRSAVTFFSRASRLRLLQKMAALKSQKLTGVFLTLTYGQSFPDPREAKRHLDNFLKRLRRKHENVSGFWRLEFQQRGAPHFHLILFGLPFVPKEELQNAWGAVVGMEFWDTSSYPFRPPFTRVEFLASHSHASRYVAKYVAKSDGADGGFNVAAYLTDDGYFIHPVTGEVCESIGRWWGVINAAGLPFADLVEIFADGFGTKALETLKRAMAATRWRINTENRFGWFSFEDNPYIWADYFEELLAIS